MFIPVSRAQLLALESTGLRSVVTLLVLLFPAMCLLMNRGDSYGLGLLSLLGGWVGFRDGFARNLKREDWYLIAAFFACFAIVILSYEFGLMTDAGFRFLGRYLRFLFILPVLVLLRRYPPSVRVVFAGLALGALLIGADALFGLLHGPVAYRAMGTAETPVLFGDLAACLLLTLAAAYGLVVATKKWWVVTAFSLCLISGLLAVLLSETRSAWLALLLFLPLFLFHLNKIISKKYLALIVAGLALLLAGIYLYPKTDVRSRLQQIVNQVSMYRYAHSSWQSRPGLKPKELPYCNDKKEFLQYWWSLTGHAADLTAEVVRDPDLIESDQLDGRCRDGYVIRIRNFEKSGWVDFRRAPARYDSSQITQFVAKGSGLFNMYGYNHGAAKEQVNFHSNIYRTITLHGEPYIGTDVAIYFTPGQTLSVVPVDGYAGEYRNTLRGTPIGLRFEMWRAAWDMFLEHPLLGVGTGAFSEVARQLARQGRIVPAAAQYDHPHSDYMDALSGRGIVGFVSLLALFFTPGIYFWRALKKSEGAYHATALAGVLLVCGFAICGLTDTVFIHSMNISWYVVFVAVFTVLCKPDDLALDTDA